MEIRFVSKFQPAADFYFYGELSTEMETHLFHRIDLDGTKIQIPNLELHQVRRDILHFYDENIGEISNLLVLEDLYRLPYWKYLSIAFEEEWAETAHYQYVIERGCLALVNGIALELLYMPIARIRKTWSPNNVSVDVMLAYMDRYQPSCALLAEGKEIVSSALKCIRNLTYADINEDGEVTSFNTVKAAEWFDHNIIHEYFRTMVKDKCSEVSGFR